MAITDPIADMLTRIRNASILRKEQAIVPTSKLKLEILRVLKLEGYISGFKIDDKGSIIYVDLNNSMEKMMRVSKPGRRVYTGKDKIPTILQGRGLVVISTSKGVMSGREAKKQGLGGELLCKVW